MSEQKPILIVGATGHVGSQVVRALAESGQQVRALVRPTSRREFLAHPRVEFAVGDLTDPASIDQALRGVDSIVATANAIIPTQRSDSVEQLAQVGYAGLIAAAERHAVRRFVLASVPSHPLEMHVPELAGKRLIEQQLAHSSVPHIVMRNPAFTDSWMAMVGCRRAIGTYPLASLRRPYGFSKTWLVLSGSLIERRGVLLAPGGPQHRHAFITTKDVAHALVGAVNHDGSESATWEIGGPEILSWQDVAARYADILGRPVRPVALPEWAAALGQTAAQPAAKSAANVLGLLRFVATFEATWPPSQLVKTLNLPPQTTVADYLTQVLRA